ncbi:MAG: hypothetical protein IPM14_00365 [bacterium]|nr:hypothetical protein [bacterium]
METIKTILIITSFLYGSCSEHNSHYESLEKTNDASQSQILERKNHMNKTSIEYAIKFNSDLNKIIAGEKTKLLFSPRIKDDESNIIKLETFHEKEAHVIIVSDDLEDFSHLHPVNEGNGNYSVEINLPFGEKYEMFIEYKPMGSDKIIERFDLNVEGREKSKAVFKNENHFFKDQSVSVILQNAEDLFSGKEIHLPVVILKDGKELNAAKFDNYLGEKAHAVLIRIANFDFQHVHPMVMNNQLNLHMNIDKIGYYRLWLQFQIDGTLHTADFVLEVKPSGHLMGQSNHNQHKH